MHLFQKRFTVPKFPTRKSASMTNLSQLDSTTRSQEFSVDFGPIKTRLSGRDLVFREGTWVIGKSTIISEAAWFLRTFTFGHVSYIHNESVFRIHWRSFMASCNWLSDFHSSSVTHGRVGTFHPSE